MQTSAIRRAANWEALGVKSPPATIVTPYDASSIMPFASAAADLLIKPFNVEEFQDAIEAARLKIIRARPALNQIHAHEDNQEPLPEKRPCLQRLAAKSDGSIVLLKGPGYFVAAVVRKSNSRAFSRGNSSAALHNEKHPGPSGSESLSQSAPQCDRESLAAHSRVALARKVCRCFRYSDHSDRR
jgi:hypothetical protein